MTKEISFQGFEKYTAKQALQMRALPLGCALMAAAGVGLYFAAMHGSLLELNLTNMLIFSGLTTAFLLYATYTGRSLIRYSRNRSSIRHEKLPKGLLSQRKELSRFNCKRFRENCFIRIKTKQLHILAIKEQQIMRIQYSGTPPEAPPGYRPQLTSVEERELFKKAINPRIRAEDL